MKHSTCPVINHDVRSLIQLGWSFSRGGKHGKLVTPCGQAFVVVPCSPSDSRSFKNFRRDVRRAEKRSADRAKTVTGASYSNPFGA